MNSWTAVPLGHVANLLSGGTPSKAQADYWNGTIPWLTPKDMRTEFVNKTEDSVTEAAIGNGTRLAPRDALFIAVRGMSLHNEIRIVRTDRAMAFNQDIKAIIPQGIDGRFLFLALSNLRAQFLASVESAGHGTGRLPTDRLESTLVPFPPPAEQRAIAEVLGAMDDKIEVNRRMSETLEGIARAIFKSWFVDFDPVRAKMEGRDPGLAPEIAALFPDRLVQTENGEVPEGWTLRPLSGLGRFLNGLALQKFPPDNKEFLPVIKIAELRAGQWTNGDKASPSIPEDYVVNDGDLLFSWSGSLLHRFWCGGPGALNQHLFKVFPQGVPAGFLFEAIGQHMPEFRAIAADKATTMGHIQRRHLDEALVAIGSDTVMQTAGEIIGACHERALLGQKQIRTLAALRDLLLPKLMSGEIRIKDAEKLLGEAGA